MSTPPQPLDEIKRIPEKMAKILFALREAESPLAGYDISMRVKVRAGHVYATMVRLERAGWVSSEWVGEGKDRHKVFSLTELGTTRTDIVKDIMGGRAG
jgi:DNA-binding PadR family transcriptional regulator